MNWASRPFGLMRGEELGAFRLGSTVVTAWTEGAVEIDRDLDGGRVVMGSRIGRLGSTANGVSSQESG